MNLAKKIIGGLVLIGLFAIGIIILVKPQRSMSENENRVLSEVPKFSMKTFMNGDFQDQIEVALSDQFPGRDAWMMVGSGIKLLEGKKSIGDAYVGKDNYFFEKVTDDDIDEDNYVFNLSKVEQLAKAFPDVNFKAMLVPSSGIILKDKLPSHAKIYSAEKMYDTAFDILSSVIVIDPTRALKNASQDKQIYYRTDHHWTTAGAYVGYKSLMGDKGQFGDYNVTVATKDFLGTLYSRVLSPWYKRDTVELPVISDSVTVKINDRDAVMYNTSCLSEKDKYKVFFGGNFGKIEIGGIGKGTLLVIKDSFANSLVPFLTDDYEKIIMIDLRYINPNERVADLIVNEKVDEALVIYEMNNFATDRNLVKLCFGL